MKLNLILAGLPEDDQPAALEQMKSLAMELLAAEAEAEAAVKAAAGRAGGTEAAEPAPQRETGAEGETGLTERSQLRVIPVSGRHCSRNLIEKTAAVLKRYPAEVHLFHGTPLGKALGAGVAAAGGWTCHTGGEGFVYEDGVRVCRKVYSAHGCGLFALEEPCVVVTAGRRRGETVCGGLREQAAEPGSETDRPLPEIVYIDELARKPETGEAESDSADVLSVRQLERQDDLAQARLVFVGGKGLGTKENYQRLQALARQFGAACGCSRPAAMSGWDSYDRVVGVSGVCLTADVCVTFGVSGAGPMMYGLEGAGRLIAVNTDKDAPIFRYAEDGILEDCGEIIGALEKGQEEKNRA